jgi:hypothetical protein
MPIVVMSDPIIVPLPVYYGTSDTRYGRPVFPKTGLFYFSSSSFYAGGGHAPFNLTKAAGLA